MRILTLLLVCRLTLAANAHSNEGSKYTLGTRSRAMGDGDKNKFDTCGALLESISWDLPLLSKYADLKKIYHARKDSKLWPMWARALQKFPEMQKAMETFPSDKLAYFDNILRATASALTKHHLAFARSRDLASMHIRRHTRILQEIGAYDESNPQFSFYKIKRAIEGRYSLREYTDCYE